jgi:hypothetical protein
MPCGSGQGRATARRSVPLMRPTGENNHIGSQSSFVTLANKICSTPISAAIFQRIYAAVNNCSATSMFTR